MLQHKCQACLLAIVQLAAISGTLSTETAPYFSVEPSDMYVRKGKSATLSCIVGGDPLPSVRWKRNGVALDLSGDNRRTINPNGSLHFSQIIHSKDAKPDEGEYKCEAVSRINNMDYKIVSKSAKLTVAGLSSKVTVTPVTIKVIFGGIARFFCSIKHSVPKAVVRWRKNGVEITTGGRFTLIPGGALQISNIKFSDQGNYMCIAENKVIARSHPSGKPGKIVVLPDQGLLHPQFVVKPVDTIAIAGSQVILECAAIGSQRPRVSWLHNGTAVVPGSTYSILGESNLKIGSVSIRQAGAYVCRAEGGQETKEAPAQLTVHYPPVFTKKPSEIHAHADSDAQFKCEADGMPKPTISWSKNGDVLENNDYTTIGDGFLLIEDLVLSDMGVYQCIAKNSLGDIQATAELSVYRKGMPLPVTSPPPSTTESTTERTTVATTTQTTTAKRQVPEMPENVMARPISDSEIEVTWVPPSVTHGVILTYGIFISSPGESKVDIVNTSGANLTKRISHLKPDKKYSFNVYAYNKHGAGAISNKAQAKTHASSLVPGKPVNLEADAESKSTIRVTWVAPDPGKSPVAKYFIIYKEAGSNSQGWTDSTTHQTRVLRGLKTYTKYTISVLAESVGGVRGAAATVDATTMSGVPWEPPENFALAPDSSGTGLIATWNPPDPKKVNGLITYYLIKYRKVGSQKENQTERIGAENLKYRIEGLLPGTTYEAKIAAGTDSGLGDFTDDWVDKTTNLTDCKESTHPGKPEITFTKAFSNMIVVKWRPPDNVGLICITTYKLSWGELNPYQGEVTLQSDKLEHVIQGLKSKQRYVIKLLATNSKGPGEDQQLEIRTKPGTGSQEPVKGLRALPQSPKVMQLTWKDTQVSTSAPVVYHVYHSVRNQLKYCGNTTQKTIKCSGLKPYTEYTFYVRRNTEGVNATVSNYTEEDKPSHPMDLTGNPHEKNFTILTLHWQLPLKPNGIIVLYRIYYSDNKKASDERWTAIEIPGSKFTWQISGLTPGKVYFFRMQAKTRKGWGPLSEVKEIHTLQVSPTKSAIGGPGGMKPATSMPPPGEAVPDQQKAVGALKNKTLWIVIAAVAGITLIAIIIISVILCKKRSGDDIQRKPPTYKSVIQANGSAKKKHKEEKPPDLWINHTENLEMKPMESVNPAPDVTNTSTIPRSSHEMKPLDDSPIDHIAIDHERNSFLNGSEKDPDDFDELPPPPMIDSKDEPYPEYIDSGNRTPTPPPSPTVSPYRSPRPTTPDHAYPSHPLTSTPRYHKVLPRAGSCDNTLGMTEPNPPQRSRSYDPDFPGVPVFPGYYPPSTLPKPKPKPHVAPADDIQLPPVGYASRKRPPNGYWTPPPKYDDIFARRSPPSSPKNQDAVVADLDKEIAGLEGLMRDLNEITAVDL